MSKLFVLVFILFTIIGLLCIVKDEMNYDKKEKYARSKLCSVPKYCDQPKYCSRQVTRYCYTPKYYTRTVTRNYA